MRHLGFILLILFGLESQGQMVYLDTTHVHDARINGIYIPKDIEDCFRVLYSVDYEITNSELISISEDSIESKFDSPAEFWHKWYFHEASRLTKYFNSLGIIYPKHMQDIILHTYYRKLHNTPIRFDEEVSKFKLIEKQEIEEYNKMLQQDSINGFYIPKNISECFSELDRLLKKEDIKEIKSLNNKTGTIMFHLTLGMWIINNWGLWGGSRLQTYMMERTQDEPDGMSAMILEIYWEWLNGINENWIKFDKKLK